MSALCMAARVAVTLMALGLLSVGTFGFFLLVAWKRDR